MTEIKEEVKNCEAPKSENTAKKPTKKGNTAKKVTEKPETSFEFSDKDIQEFKDWKREKEVKAQVTCGSAEEDKVYRMWKEESRMVKGVFRCRQPAGGNVKFCFRKYKWDETKWYTMFDGQVYEVPLAVARHLNANCNYPVHSHILGADGNPLVDRQGKVESRMNFESTEFAVA